ncbi:MAG: cytochrome b N-terminal domain-containing protein, partial [Acidobacteriota bacterium]|nr:cytochrome b N-terminal domain-containing protein [Acidobacteriota bacterium]
AATALVGLHVLLVQMHGMSVPQKYEGEKLKKMKFFPNFFMRDLVGWLLAIGVLAALAAIFPWELGEKADPFAPAPEGIKPEWYFLFVFQTLKFLPAKIGSLDGEVIGIMAFGLAATALVFVPFLDKTNPSRKRRLVFKALGVTAILYIVVMTIIGWLT